MFPPTEEQRAIIEAARDTQASLMISAYAGCGKSTTLEMLANAIPSQPAMALAFNKKIATELQKRFPNHFEIKTLNGLGHSAWQKAIGRRLVLDEKKIFNLLKQLIKDEGLDKTIAQEEDSFGEILRLVNAARMRGIVPEPFPHKGLLQNRPEVWEDIQNELYMGEESWKWQLAERVLHHSVKMAFQGTIDFDDQIYMSTIFNGVFPKFPLVLVDEAQDLSPLNHIQLARVSAGRLIVCGDPRQAIYAFRGADSASMAKIRKLKSEWIDLPLYLTFRCPKVIVQACQEHAVGFRAAEGNAQGTILRMEGEPWTWEDIPTGGSQAIICRNNAPLLAMAFKLIRKGIGCHMLGRDIGKGLVALSKKICKEDDVPVADFLALVHQWAENERRAAKAKEQEHKISGIEDREQCFYAVAEFGGIATVGDLRREIEALFAKSEGRVTLGTGHRVKGLEYDTTVYLDSFRIPSKYAVAMATRGDGAQLEQEMNLDYVIKTRAKKVMVYADEEKFQ